MMKLGILVGVVAVAVFATAALSGNAGVRQAALERAHAATLQQQVNELRSELICLETVTGNGLAAADLWAASATTANALTAEQALDDRGVCKKLGVTAPGTTPSRPITPAFSQLIHRAFGR